jgi:hypothetical protein
MIDREAAVAALRRTPTGRLRQVAAVVAVVPWFLTATLYRRWHLRWGATTHAVTSAMRGDDLVPVSHFHRDASDHHRRST